MITCAPAFEFEKPSAVLNLKAEYVGKNSVKLTWAVSDAASNSYTYRIEVVNDTSVWNLTSNVTEVEITELIPGTLYNFTVFAITNSGETEGEGVSISRYTKPSAVIDLKAEYVGKNSVNLTWVVNDTASNSYTYRIEVVNGIFVRNLTSNVTEVEITELIPGTLYNFTVFAVAADGQTEGEGVSISLYTNPPAPSKAPLVKAVSHSSLSVEFPDFESVNGPLKAYAVMITTEEQGCKALKFKLNNTYKDFEKKMTDTYVTYIIDTEQAKSPSLHSQNHTNIVNVGKGNTMHGYENGPLIPLHSYRSKMIKVENFESYFKKQQADSNCGFAEEYEELKSAGVHQPKFAAELAENRGKNRYNNVLPYDISRVKLSDQSSPTDDYINANYMPGYNSKKAFIAAQGPLPNTIEDFWRMIWEKNIYSIVMLTKCVEQARTKCEQYWPDNQSKNYGDIIVTKVSEIDLPEWTIRDFTVEKSNTTESHTVRQFHFTSWPDHGVPETTDLLINFRHLVHEYSSQNPIDSPTLVHCSAGVGRTGTFIAIDRLIQQIEMENTVDVYGVVYDLRMHRPLMVQTEDQYIFLNQCVMDIIRSQKDKKTDLIYQNMTAMAIYENFTPGPGFGKANGYHA
ncbi:receptor-type tyrosine-protein phosphatase eta [Grus japonensis]|uniref:Receptor-type tyrosine-protein phosphatase eta n=1 Tax=Grus japonensis TaxID=30415 RepID=A0ABC9WX31_GRUJA